MWAVYLTYRYKEIIKKTKAVNTIASKDPATQLCQNLYMYILTTKQ